ncbi:MAG TPA: hypothetical protein VF257_14925, partial [Solirubrobacteraceae bacterium]
RAAVRGLHEASRPLSVVFPAAGLVVAGAGAEHTSSFFVRVYETLSMHVHERTANSFVRAQAIVDALTAGKMAAAAASAAALAGGGVAVEGALTSAPERPAALMRHVESNASLAFVKQSAHRDVKTRTHAKARSHVGSSPPRRRQAAARPIVKPASALRASASRSAATTRRATVASTSSARSAATSASSEFGFEGP